MLRNTQSGNYFVMYLIKSCSNSLISINIFAVLIYLAVTALQMAPQ